MQHCDDCRIRSVMSANWSCVWLMRGLGCSRQTVITDSNSHGTYCRYCIYSKVAFSSLHQSATERKLRTSGRWWRWVRIGKIVRMMCRSDKKCCAFFWCVSQTFSELRIPRNQWNTDSVCIHVAVKNSTFNIMLDSHRQRDETRQLCRVGSATSAVWIRHKRVNGGVRQSVVKRSALFRLMHSINNQRQRFNVILPVLQQ